MEPLLGLVAAAVFASIASLVASARRREQVLAWRRAAARAGLADLEESEGGLFAGGSVRGRSGELEVRLDGYRRGRYEQGTKIVVTGLRHGMGGLSLRREGLGTAIEKRVLGEREIEIGDASFDDEYYVQGSAPLAVAVLDPETRRSVAALLRNRIALPGGRWVDVDASLRDGALEVRVKESGFSGNRERVPDILAVALDVARRLVAPVDLAARIAENLRTESSVGARVASVRVLAREFPGHPATRDALLAACRDRSEEERLRAGVALGEEGRETLLELANGPGVPDGCAAQAIRALGDRLPPEQAEAALRRALGGTAREETAVACLEALALAGHAPAEGLIVEALLKGDPQVAVAAARALGKVGSAGAVAALHEAMAPRGDLLRSVGRQAIAEIQARLTGAAPGQLSLAGGGAGALSLADSTGEPGRVSLAEEGPEGARRPQEEGETQAPPQRGRTPRLTS